MAKKHYTPGPWTREFASCGEIDPRCRGGWQIVGPHYSRPHGYVNEADARLIAAAPDLLASLREFVALYDGCRDMLGAAVAEKLARAEAVIAKAEEN